MSVEGNTWAQEMIRAKEGLELEQQDMADPERAAVVRRVKAIRDAVYEGHIRHDKEGDKLYDAYREFEKTLPFEARVTHYFQGSSPGGDIQLFDIDTNPILQKIEAFAREHGILQDRSN